MKAPTKTPNTESRGYYSDMSQSLFSKWRNYRLLSAFCGAIALIPALIDYELSYPLTLDSNNAYSSPRDIDTCAHSDSNTVWLRVIVLLLSLIATILLIPYKIYYYRWLKNVPLTFKEMPPYHGVAVLEVMEMQRKRKLHEYFLEGGTFIPVILYLLFPYPGDYSTVTVSQQILYEQVDVCYYTSEILYAIMYFRIGYFALAMFSYGRFQTQLAFATAERYGVQITPAFSMKCYIGAYPMVILVFCFLIPGVVMFGLLMRIFERVRADQDYHTTVNAFWNIIITMTTVGYGDTFATTVLGRTMVIFSIFWGGIILSLTFVTVGSVLQLKANEKRAYTAIIVGRGAADAIGYALTTAKHDHKNKDKWASIRAKLRTFIVLQRTDPSNESFIAHSSSLVALKLNNLEQKADRIMERLEKVKATIE